MTVKRLIEVGISIFTEDNEGLSPLLVASQHGRLEVVDVFDLGRRRCVGVGRKVQENSIALGNTKWTCKGDKTFVS